MPQATRNSIRQAPPRADRLFRALADPIRLTILRLLQRADELCVCDIVAALRVPQPTASRHLAYLRRAGLVEARKQEQWAYYRLSAPRGALHRRLLACVECCGDAVGARATTRAGASCCTPAAAAQRIAPAASNRASRRNGSCC